MGMGNGEGSIFTDRETRMRLEIGGTTLYPIAKIIHGWDMDEDEANSALVAAAPELLDACKRALSIAERTQRENADDNPWRVAAKKLRDAIAKAEGGAS